MRLQRVPLPLLLCGFVARRWSSMKQEVTLHQTVTLLETDLGVSASRTLRNKCLVSHLLYGIFLLQQRKCTKKLTHNLWEKKTGLESKLPCGELEYSQRMLSEGPLNLLGVYRGSGENVVATRLFRPQTGPVIVRLILIPLPSGNEYCFLISI